MPPVWNIWVSNCEEVSNCDEQLLGDFSRKISIPITFSIKFSIPRNLSTKLLDSEKFLKNSSRFREDDIYKYWVLWLCSSVAEPRELMTKEELKSQKCRSGGRRGNFSIPRSFSRIVLDSEKMTSISIGYCGSVPRLRNLENLWQRKNSRAKSVDQAGGGGCDVIITCSTS